MYFGMFIDVHHHLDVCRLTNCWLMWCWQKPRERGSGREMLPLN